MWRYVLTDELYHHGVKGQEWGVRHGPPYPIEDRVMRKGTVVASVSGNKNAKSYQNSGRPMYAYNPNDKWDSKVYKGPYSYFLTRYRGVEAVKEHRYKLVKDLRMPTKKDRLQEFKDLYTSDSFNKEVVKTLNSAKRMSTKKWLKDHKADVDPSNIKTDADWDGAYFLFNNAMGYAHRFKSTTEYMNRMSKKYDAMVDDNNVGVFNNAHDPVIIFRANEVLKKIGSVKVKDLEIRKNISEVEKVLGKWTV